MTKLYPRQVWWCNIVNDPFILTWKDERAYCPLCNWIDIDGTPVEASSAFESVHDYLENAKTIQRRVYGNT